MRNPRYGAITQGVSTLDSSNDVCVYRVIIYIGREKAWGRRIREREGKVASTLSSFRLIGGVFCVRERVWRERESGVYVLLGFGLRFFSVFLFT